MFSFWPFSGDWAGFGPAVADAPFVVPHVARRGDSALARTLGARSADAAHAPEQRWHLAWLIPYVLMSCASVAHVLALCGALSLAAAPARGVEIAYGCWAALTLLLAQHRLGCLLARLSWLGDWGVSAFGARALFHLALGTSASATVFLTLLLLHWFRAVGLGIVCAVLLGLAGREVWVRLRAALGAFAAGPSETWRRPHFLLLILALVWLVPFAVQTLLPSTDWDTAMYHLPIARTALDDSPWAVDPYFIALDYPGVPHLFYALFLAIHAEAAVVPFAFLNGLAVLLATHAMTAHFWGRKAALGAVFVLLTANVLWLVSVTARIDGMLTLWFVLAVFVLLHWRQAPQRRGLVPLLGLLLGLGLGTKYTALFFLPVLAVPVAVWAWTSADHRRALISPATLFAVILLLVPASFWYVRNAVLLGDPLYDLGRHRLVYRDDDGHYRSYDDLVAERGHLLLPPAEAEERLAQSDYAALAQPPRNTRLYAAHLWNVPDVLWHPERYETQPRHSLGPFLLLGLLLPLALRSGLALWLWGTAVALYLILAPQTWVLRYALPLLPLLASGAGVCLARWEESPHRLWRGVTPLVTILASVYLLGLWVNQLVAVTALQPRAYLAGDENKLQFLARIGYNRTRDVFPAVQAINDKIDRGEMPADAKILMIGEAKGGELRCRYLPDTCPLGYRWEVAALQSRGDNETLRRRLQEQGIEYLLINRSYLCLAYHFATDGTTPEQLRTRLVHLDTFLGECCTTIYRDNNVCVVRLNPNE